MRIYRGLLGNSGGITNKSLAYVWWIIVNNKADGGICDSQQMMVGFSSSILAGFLSTIGKHPWWLRDVGTNSSA